MWIGLAALCAVTMAAACTLDDFVEFGGIIGVDDGASEGTSKSLRVDGSAEQRLELKTGAAITIPKDAVDKMIEISMERPDDKAAVTLVKSLKNVEAVVSAPYVLTPHGTKFKSAVSVELPVSKSTDKKLVVGWLEDENDKNWKRLGEPVVKDGIAKIDIDHFSVLVLLEEDKANLSDDGADAGSTPAQSRDGGTLGAAGDAGAEPDDGEPDAAPQGQPRDASAGIADAGTGGAWPDASAGASDAAVVPPLDAPWDEVPDAGAGGGAADSAVAPADSGTGAPDSGTDAGDADAGGDSGMSMVELDASPAF